MMLSRRVSRPYLDDFNPVTTQSKKEDGLISHEESLQNYAHESESKELQQTSRILDANFDSERAEVPH